MRENTKSSKPAPTPLFERLRAAGDMTPAIRRVYALILLRQMLRSSFPVAIGTALNWHSMGLLLGQCSIDLQPRRHTMPPVAGDPARADYFWGLGEQAFALARAVRGDVERQRPGRGQPIAKRVRRGWKPRGRVIEVASAPEVG